MNKFKVKMEQFADVKILRYQVEGFEELDLQRKKLLYFLSEAAYWGRDILYDQNYKHNLKIRRCLEAIYKFYPGDRSSEAWQQFEVYLKRIWYANGIHHTYSTDKFFPEFSREYWHELYEQTPKESFGKEQFDADFLAEIIFSPDIAAKRVCLDTNKDLIAESACNFYENVKQSEVEDYIRQHLNAEDEEPVSFGLNSKLLKKDGQLQEQVYKIGGMYSPAIEKIAYWLENAAFVAENEEQREALLKLVEFYETGDLKTFDEYNKLWLKDTESTIDTINGFIEVYGDPLGHKATWEAVVQMKDEKTNRLFGKIAEEANWFEQNSPIMDAHKREEAKGVIYNVVSVVAESGDCSPSTPIGINLPNADWLRERYGSKSVSLVNIEDAYENVSQEEGALQEFYLPHQQEILKQYKGLGSKLHTGLHEVIGHGSGKVLDGVGSPKDSLKSYASTLEEARADLVALYFMPDEHLTEMGLTPGPEVAQSEYITYIYNGLMIQLSRIEEGNTIEESHMRNRQLVAKWVFDRAQDSQAVIQFKQEGKTYFEIKDYEQMRTLFGELLREIQRIKSEGDYEAGKHLVETYGVKPDPALHREARERWAKLKIAPFSGFINPVLVPVMDDGLITDVKLEYPEVFAEQMLYYSQKYSNLPSDN